MVEQGTAGIVAEGISPAQVTIERLLDMRYQGQSYELTIPLTANFASDFHAAHAQAYGYNEPKMPVEVVNLRVRAIGGLTHLALPRTPWGQTDPAVALFDRRNVVLVEGMIEVPFYSGPDLRPGHQIIGPAVIIHPDTTVFLGSEDKLVMDEYMNLIIDVNGDR
jgi:N-methylhydantoinase A